MDTHHLETPKSFTSQITEAALELKCIAVIEKIEAGQFIPNPSLMLFSQIVTIAIVHAKRRITSGSKIIFEDKIDDP